MGELQYLICDFLCWCSDTTFKSLSIPAASSFPPAWESPFNITTPTTAARCTFGEFWSPLVEYLCTQSVGQPYVNAIIATDAACIPIAWHYANYCGRANNRYCLNILQGSFPLINPTQCFRQSLFEKCNHRMCKLHDIHIEHVPCTLQKCIKDSIK